MSDRFIDVRDVSKIYPGSTEIRALSNASLRIEDGERVGIIGPNGAGKSTLLQIIANVLPPTSGSVEVKGKVHAILAVGMGLREEATGRENLFLDGAVIGRSHAATQANLQKMIDFAELGEFIDQPVRTYSSGMKARLGFASLITVDPEILIIDEALSVGDAFFNTKATEAIKELTERGGIVIVVAHSLGTIKQMCNRAIWIESGVVKMDGSADDVTDAYRDYLHVRDEEDIKRKFGNSGAAWTKNKKEYVIDSVELCSARDGAQRALLESGEEATLSVAIRGKGASRAFRLKIWAERNDGLVVFEETVDMPATTLPRREVYIDLGRLSLRPFIYQIHAEIVTPNKGIVAHNATVVKIWSDREVTGGAPLLRQAVHVSASRVSEAGS